MEWFLDQSWADESDENRGHIVGRWIEARKLALGGTGSVPTPTTDFAK